MNGIYLATHLDLMRSVILAFKNFLDSYFLPVFENLEAKAEEIANSSFDQRMSEPAGEDCDVDPADVAEAASEQGQHFYEMMYSLRQTSLNMFGATLFHLLEQQLASLFQDAGFDVNGISVPDSKLSVVRTAYCEHCGLDLGNLVEWSKIDELRLVANVVKHGEGPSAEQLRQIRPELFTDPRMRQLTPRWTSMDLPLGSPLSGEGLFVTPEVLGEYVETVEAFVVSIRDHFQAHGNEHYPTRDC